ncbi:hypothetical protein [Chryseobacterium luteum]|uniref:Uncharacterized protein n=1 Tax=Chryseobacterium luteum TaxID=421531 RepID=A0A085ZGL8_9FLAO|nr:hypothetical protein [Chryseobacterium luteum]KFF03582.1 hypothetical protein IX38_11465 [Chryseobacterium luteum]
MDINYMNILINDHNTNFELLKKFIISMNITLGMNKNFCAHLAEKVLQQLEKGADMPKIQCIIESELCVGYGLYRDEFNSKKITNEIMHWWENT